MAQDQKTSQKAKGRSKAADTAIAVVEPTVEPVAVLPSSGDPDRVVADLTVGPVPAQVTARDAQRGAASGIRSEMRAMIKAARMARDVADGLTTLVEVESAHSAAFAHSVKIELRRMGAIDVPKA